MWLGRVGAACGSGVVCCARARTRCGAGTRAPRRPPCHVATLPPRPGARVVYTYDVYWDTSNITWSSRWDAYLRMPGGKVHWFSILNSLMVVVRRGSVARVCDQGGSGRQDGGAWRPPWLPPPALKATAVLACHPRCRAAPRHAPPPGQVVMSCHCGHDHDAHHSPRPAALRAAAGGRRCGGGGRRGGGGAGVQGCVGVQGYVAAEGCGGNAVAARGRYAPCMLAAGRPGCR